MACRSCGLGPGRPKNRVPLAQPATNRSKPPKGVIQTTKQKTTIPTRSPSKTFTTVGDP